MHSLNTGTRIIKGSANILGVVRQFYSKLYDKAIPPTLNDAAFCDNFFANCPKLEDHHKVMLARPLNMVELREALKSCKDSAPGLDGIPYSFYAACPGLLRYVLESWDFALESGTMATSHSRSCITLLPKKGKDLTIIGNWRPISLSACDLKIVTKAYAARLKGVLPSVLMESQAAYTPGRDISFNNRLLQYAKLYARRATKDFCVVSLDAQKAFDSVSHQYIAKTLEVYDFPPEFIKVFKTLYSELYSVVQVNGFLSEEFRIFNGVKQGDALSCGLFVLAIDPLIRNIKANVHIEGLNIPTDPREVAEIKVLAYADDVSIVCKNGNLQPIFEEYDSFSRISGLVLNADKTEVFNLIVSPVVLSNIKYQDKEYALGRVDSIRICGIWLSESVEAEYKANVQERIEGMEATVSGWGRRNLSLNGRMILAKTFLLSLIVFPAQVVQIRGKEIKKIEKLIYSFVNGCKNLYGPERIARAHLKAPKCQGGINGVDVEVFVKSIVISQFVKASRQLPLLRTLQESLECPIADEITSGARATFRQNYRQGISGYAIPDIEQTNLISGIPLSLLISSKTAAARFAAHESLKTMSDLQEAFLLGRNRTKVSSIIRAIPASLANLVRSGLLTQSPSKIIWLCTSTIIESSKITTKGIKEHLISQKFSGIKLEKIYKRADWPPPGINYEPSFSNLWKIKHPSLRAVRLKVVYKDIFSNERRYRFDLSDSPDCDVCGEVETVEHHLATCNNALRMWNLYHRITSQRVNSLLEVIMCGSSLEHEIIKSVIIKHLIQIDRSRNASDRAIALQCAFYLELEARSSPKVADRLGQLAQNIRNIF